MNHEPRYRNGFSLIELVGSLLAASALVIGLASTMGVALRASNPNNTPAANTLEGLNLLSEMAGEMTYAQAFTEKTAVAVTATIPDRGDADTSSDSLRYSWSGTPGDPLIRSYNGNSPETAVDDVQEFSITYYPATGPVGLMVVKIQVSADSRTAVETTISTLNLP